MIPLYRMEEHNEAFYYWKKAILDGYMPESGNLLLHVDHHDDMLCGGYFHDFRKEMKEMKEVEQFTYECLGIADFIIPAVYEGIFDSVMIMKSLLPATWKSQERVIKRMSNYELSMCNYIPFLHGDIRRKEEEGYRFFTYYEGGLSELPVQGSLVLDIDLDYFCWDDSLSGTAPKRLEITEEAYWEYKTNRYHPFRILPKRLLMTEKKDGKYYLVYKESIMEEKRPDLGQIEKRIDRFFSWIRQMNCKPCVIDVCRSVQSGYLPEDVSEFVEERVLKGLNCMDKEESL